MIDKILQCTLFQGLSQDQILELIATINYKIKNYSKGDLVVASSVECRFLLIVISGSVKGEMVDFSGKTIKIEDIESPGVLAPAFLFGANNRYPVDIVANNDAEIFSVSKENFISIMMANETVLANYLNSISDRAQFLSSKLRFLSFQSLKGKIAHFLLELKKNSNCSSVVLPQSQAQLAELFGVARPSLARTIRELDSENIISAQGKRIQILDEEKLCKYLSDTL